MTDHELAQNLIDAERDGDTDNILYYENMILARLGITAVEELLTQHENEAIAKFCQDNGAQ